MQEKLFKFLAAELCSRKIRICFVHREDSSDILRHNEILRTVVELKNSVPLFIIIFIFFFTPLFIDGPT